MKFTTSWRRSSPRSSGRRGAVRNSLAKAIHWKHEIRADAANRGLLRPNEISMRRYGIWSSFCKALAYVRSRQSHGKWGRSAVSCRTINCGSHALVIDFDDAVATTPSSGRRSLLNPTSRELHVVRARLARRAPDRISRVGSWVHTGPQRVACPARKAPRRDKLRTRGRVQGGAILSAKLATIRMQ